MYITFADTAKGKRFKPFCNAANFCKTKNKKQSKKKKKKKKRTEKNKHCICLYTINLEIIMEVMQVVTEVKTPVSFKRMSYSICSSFFLFFFFFCSFPISVKKILNIL